MSGRILNLDKARKNSYLIEMTVADPEMAKRVAALKRMFPINAHMLIWIENLNSVVHIGALESTHLVRVCDYELKDGMLHMKDLASLFSGKEEFFEHFRQSNFDSHEAME